MSVSRSTTFAAVFLRLAVMVLPLAVLSACTYAKLARPSVLAQVTPEVARLVNYLPEVDQPNEAMIAKMFALGGLSHAELGDDGVMRDHVYVPSGEFIWTPTIIVMPQPGELELTFTNGDDFSHHAAYLPSNGDRQYIHLPMHTSGRARPGMPGARAARQGTRSRCRLANRCSPGRSIATAKRGRI